LLDTIKFDVVAVSSDWHPTDHISFFDNLSRRAHLLTNDSISYDELAIYKIATFSIDGILNFEQTLWPRHCVQNTYGAQIHSDLKLPDQTINPNTSLIHIYKGTKSDLDSYSAFWDNLKLSETSLHEQLKARHITQVFVTGLATDWCVYSTAMHAMEHGYKTFIIEDACRGVDENTIKQRLNDFVANNGHIIQSDDVSKYID
jgi:nicotinamidase/pyrazinamidase